MSGRLLFSAAVTMALGGCALMPPTVRVDAPAPGTALSCAREVLQQKGYEVSGTAAEGRSFTAQRVVEEASWFRVDYVVRATLRPNHTHVLRLDGETVYTRSAPFEALGRPSLRPSERRRINPDDALGVEVRGVIDVCAPTVDLRGGTARGRTDADRLLALLGPS